MKKLLLLLATVQLLLCCRAASADTYPRPGSLVVGKCGAANLPILVGTQPNYVSTQILQNGNLCVNGAGGGGGANTPTSASGAYGSGATVTTTSAQVLASATARVFLDLKNESTSQSIACAFGAPAVLNTKGSFTIAAGGDKTWEGTFVPSDAVNCITSTGTAPLTIGAD